MEINNTSKVQHVRQPLTAVIILILVSGCASPYAGDSPEAIEKRKEVAAAFLDTFAPAGCSYNLYVQEYQCDGDQPEKLNKRVPTFVDECMEWLEKNPWGGNSDYIGEYALSELYYCRTKWGEKITGPANVFYCESELPPILLELMRDSGYTITMSRYQDRFKYVAFKP